MRRNYLYANRNSLNQSGLAMLCLLIFFAATGVFLSLFFYQDLKNALRKFKEFQQPLTPVFIQPEISVPKLETITNNLDPSEKEAEKIFIAYDLGDDRLASRLITDFLANYPDNPLQNRVRIIGANLMYKRGDSAGALAYIKKVLSESKLENEDFTDAVLLLGSISREQKQYDSFIQSYLEQAYFRASEPAKSMLAFYLGYMMIHNKDFKNAASYFNNVIGENGVLGRADLYAAQEMRPETINAFANFLDLYPASQNFSYVKDAFIKESKLQASSLAARGYLDSAVNFYQNIAARFPGTQDADFARLQSADIYIQKKDLKKAVALLEQILDNDDKFYDPDALFRLGKIHFEQDNPEQALNSFRTLAEQFPSGPMIREAQEWQRLILESLAN